LGLPGEAESPAREAVRRGRNPATLRTLSEILFQQGGTDRTAEAEELLRAALAHSPEDPVTLQALAVQLRSRDEHREAVRLLRRLLRARPFTVEAYPLLIHSYRSLGNVTTAADVERIYRVLLPRDSRLARARFLASVTEGSPASLTHLARAYLDAGTPDQARLLLARPPLAGIATPELVQLRRRAEQASPYQAPALPADPEGDAP